MKYNIRGERELRQILKGQRPYESRESIAGRYKVSGIVNNYASGLGSYGDSKAAPYVAKFKAPTASDSALLDKYYLPGHYPSRDTLTELGEITSKKSLLPLALLVIGALWLFKH
jgi:hypothetical protein